MAENADSDQEPAAGGKDVIEQMTAAASNTKDDNSADEGEDIRVESDEPMDEETAIKNLTTGVRNQDDLERDITYQANLTMIQAEDKKDEKRIGRSQATIKKLQAQKKTQEEKFNKAIGKPELKLKIRQEIGRLDAEIELCNKDMDDFHTRINQRHKDSEEDHAVDQGGSSRKLPSESYREFLIRTGKITPFSNFGGHRQDVPDGPLASAFINAEDEIGAEEILEKNEYEPRSHQNLRAPGFLEDFDDTPAPPCGSVETEFSLRPRKKRKTQRKDDLSSDEFVPEPRSSRSKAATAKEDTDDEESDDFDLTERPRKKPQKKSKATQESAKEDLSNIDDGNENVYQTRLADWVERRSRARVRQKIAASSAEAEGSGPSGEADDKTDEAEWFRLCPDEADHVLEDGLKIPGDIFPALFDYQKTGVQWLAQLWSSRVGGIIGDEMGLGKTVQLISFVAALHYSKKLDKPVIVVAPATVLRQWANEFHRWWPPMRVSILHSSGSGMLSIGDEDRIEEEELGWEDLEGVKASSKAATRIVNRVVKHGHVLVTTYAGLQTYGDILIPIDWGYAVLDEGHKIRNPNTAITVYCKELRTPHRIILSGTPMQNNLMELWSLFDFVYPMRLGTLIGFRNDFEVPIKMGGYANATNLQIMTAQKCAESLKDVIGPYLLQRLKVDVASDLPKKSEQVLFCKLTTAQRSAYELFLSSDEMKAIYQKTRQSLYGIDILRKICNHPDLLNPNLKSRFGYTWGSPNKSGKMKVVKSLLQTWKSYGHKTLLFSQGVQMLDILEKFVRDLGGLRCLRMDGSTPIKERQTLVDRFNTDPGLDVFLLTTKVGGLGVNLTGANRVIIFDPDWNPSTDLQARERAWRLGQKKEVTIYRLMTAGTIEEKIYHRQVFKQFLSNKVLKDPKQRTSFANHDLHDLFSLGDEAADATETSKLFQGSEVRFPNVRRNSRPGTATSATPATPATNAATKLPIRENTAKGNEAEVLRTMDGVAGLEDYKPDGEDQPPPNEEDRIMQGLFARSGVHSALEHDQIINHDGKARANPAILLAEANRVAAAAAASLRRAGEQARRVPIGTVTWTGEVGEAGRPRGANNARRGRAGPSSWAILANLASRDAGARPQHPGPGGSLARPGSSQGGSQGGSQGSGTTGSAEATPAPSVALRRKDFIKMIPDYIRRCGGQVPSKTLVDHFGRYCVTGKQTEEFKKALDLVARMEKKGSGMRAVWGLKPGF